MPKFYLLVTKTRKGSEVPLGTRWDIVRDTLVGCGQDADLCFADRWMADRHALLRVAGEKVWLENQSRKVTRVNRLAIDGPAELRLGDHVQMGGVTMRVERMEEDIELRSSSSAANSPALIVRTDGATLLDCRLEMPRVSLLVLRAMALRPNEWIPSAEIAKEVWGTQWTRKLDGLGKCVGILRRACVTVLDDEALELLRGEVQGALGKGDTYLQHKSRPQLMREFVKSNRTQGFRLHLDSGRVQVI